MDRILLCDLISTACRVQLCKVLVRLARESPLQPMVTWVSVQEFVEKGEGQVFVAGKRRERERDMVLL